MRNTATLSVILALGFALVGCSTSSADVEEPSEPTRHTDDRSPPVGGHLEPLEDSELIPVADSPILGDPEAPVTIVEFTSMQCPYCGQAAEPLTQIVDEYDGQVRLVFKHFPLPMQPQARPASRALVAAHQQGDDAFWDMKNALFDRLDEYGSRPMEKLSAEIAEQIGLDVDQFLADLDDPGIDDIIERDFQLGQRLGVSGTPAFLINGHSMTGTLPYRDYARIVDSQLELLDELRDDDVPREALYREAVRHNLGEHGE